MWVGEANPTAISISWPRPTAANKIRETIGTQPSKVSRANVANVR